MIQIPWNLFPDEKPPVIYENNQNESKAFYWVALAGNQETVLLWHGYKTLNINRWEWPCGKVFHGDVLAWCTPPTYP